MSYENLELSIADGVARLTVNRPKVMNALDAETLGEMADVFEHCQQNESVRALVVTGSKLTVLYWLTFIP